ncbi:MAG: DegV family protein [Clostridiales bacterium]|nr:DegV family protein [Clostridiales bacterium]
MTDYQIITDATADLTEELAESLGVKVIPMTVEMEGKDYIIGGRESTITVEEFYERMKKGEVARTSQINTNTYAQFFGEELSKGRDVLLISFSSGLSKSTEYAFACAEKMVAEHPERKIRVVDTLCASLGEALMVYAAAMKQKEGMGIDELADWVETNKWLLAHWVTVDDLSYLQRGGRISAASAVVGTVLNIKPIIFVNDEGKLISVNKVRGRKKSLDTLHETIRERWSGGSREEPVFIGYGTELDDALYLKEQLMAGDGPKDVHVYHIGPVIGAHTGPSVIAVFSFGDKR